MAEAKLPFFKVGETIAIAQSEIYSGHYIGEIAPIWEHTKGEGIKVMVGDTGAPDQSGVDNAKMFNTTSEEGFFDKNSHGSHVDSTIAAKHDPLRSKMLGIAPSIVNLPVKTLTSSGTGTERNIQDTIEEAIREQVDILSLSLDMPFISTKTYELVTKAVEDYGIIIVVAAGNSSSNKCGGLASHHLTTAVGALNKNGTVAYFSDTCDEVNIYYYGVKTVAYMAAKNELGEMSGTSMATPKVTAVLALLKSYARKHKIDYNLVKLLYDTADYMGDGQGMGHGKMNPLKAFNKLKAMKESIQVPFDEEEVIEEEVVQCNGSCDDCICGKEEDRDTDVIVAIVAVVIILGIIIFNFVG